MCKKDIYNELFSFKIKKRRKVLILAMNNIEEYISTCINTIINKNIKLDFIDIGTNSLDTLPRNLHNFDVVICDNILSFQGNISENIKYLKSLLTENGGILMLITPLEVNKDNFYHFKLFVGLNVGYGYLDDFFHVLQSNKLKVIDNYRIHTSSNYFYSTNMFCISCIDW